MLTHTAYLANITVARVLHCAVIGLQPEKCVQSGETKILFTIGKVVSRLVFASFSNNEVLFLPFSCTSATQAIDQAEFRSFKYYCLPYGSLDDR